jgi:hypothetical protein
MAKKDDRLEVLVTVLVPRGPGCRTVDEVIDAIGDRLNPWYWTAQLPIDSEDD